MESAEGKIKLGISACLLGHKVRFDGGHKLDSFLRDTLSRWVSYVPVCPETELGLGIPREPLRLVGNPDCPRLVTVRSGIDYTEAMQDWAHRRVQELEAEHLCGFIFKSKSPSSGMERVKVYGTTGGAPVKKGIGMFARIFMEHFPLLAVEEEGRLQDPELRENFIERIFVFKRWRELVHHKPTAGKLVEFHTRHKLLLLSHSPQHYHRLGALVATVQQHGVEATCAQYAPLLMEALTLKATVRKQVNVLHHMMGYFKKDLNHEEKQELLEAIDAFRRSYVPLVVPLTLLHHYVRKYRQSYLASQYYLTPHPIELKLRNHA